MNQVSFFFSFDIYEKLLRGEELVHLGDDSRVHTCCCLAVGIACFYLLIFTLRNLRVPIGRHVAWFIQIYVPDRITSLKSADPAQINNINYYLGPGKDDEVSLTFIS